MLQINEGGGNVSCDESLFRLVDRMGIPITCFLSNFAAGEDHAADTGRTLTTRRSLMIKMFYARDGARHIAARLVIVTAEETVAAPALRRQRTEGVVGLRQNGMFRRHP